MNQAKRYSIIMAVCMLPVIAILVLSAYYFRIAYSHYIFAQDTTSAVVTFAGAVASLLIVPYTTMSVHEHGHKYLFFLAGAESAISNKDTSYNLSYLHFLRQFFSLKGGYGWITNTDIPDFDKRLLKRDPIMYVLVCSAGILANIIISILLVLPLVIANIEIGWYSCSVSLFVLVYTLYTLAEYWTNIVNNKNKNRDGFKARSALNGMDENTVGQAFRYKLKVAFLYINIKLFLAAFYLFENPIYIVGVALSINIFIRGLSLISAVYDMLYRIGFCFVLFHLFVRILNESTYLNKFNNEIMMYPWLRHMNKIKGNRKPKIELLTDYYEKGIIMYCDTFSINRLLARPLYIKTYQVTIDSFRRRYPSFEMDISQVNQETNWNRIFFARPCLLFNHLGYQHITRKEACYKIRMSHEKLMEFRRFITHELP